MWLLRLNISILAGIQLFIRLNFLNNLPLNQIKRIIAIKPASTGINTAIIDNPNAEPASTVDTTGFAIPPVVAVDAALVTVVPV